MEEKINYWEKEKQETLDKLENAKYAKDSLLIMQYKIQLDIIESHLYKLKNG